MILKHPINVVFHILGTIFSVFLCSWYLGVLECVDVQNIQRILCDSFFIVGGILFGVGIVSFCWKSGVFSVGGTPEERKKASEGKKWLKTLTVCGVSCIVMAYALTFSSRAFQ